MKALTVFEEGRKTQSGNTLGFTKHSLIITKKALIELFLPLVERVLYDGGLEESWLRQW